MKIFISFSTVKNDSVSADNVCVGLVYLKAANEGIENTRADVEETHFDRTAKEQLEEGLE